MKQLQNNYTTQEQSKRLLELGVPADSADCYYSRMKYDEYENPKILYMKYSDVACFHPKTFIYLPCWSVGRLIENSIICGIGDRVPNELYINKYSLDPSLVENIIHRLERVSDLSVNDIDFSILED